MSVQLLRKCCCGGCSLCSGDDSDTFTVTLDSAITICTGCHDLSSGQSVNVVTATLAGGTSWCLTRTESDPCFWLYKSPGEVTGTHYFGSGCSLGNQPIDGLYVSLNRGASTSTLIIQMYSGFSDLAFTGSSLFQGTSTPSGSDCHASSYTNIFTSCTNASSGHSATATVTPECGI